MNDKCITPEMPYCPSCPKGGVIYKDEDCDGYEEPTDCEWYCMIGGLEDERY